MILILLQKLTLVVFTHVCHFFVSLETLHLCCELFDEIVF